MNRFKIVPIIILCIFFQNVAYSQIWTQLDSIGDTHIDYRSIITKDSLGNLFVAAHFDQTAYIGPDTLICAGATDISLTKYDSTGKVIWTKSFGGNDYENVTDILIYKQNIFLTGMFTFSTRFDGQNLNSYGVDDIFIAKLDINGNLIWIRNAGGISNDNSNEMTVDQSGNLYITGDFEMTANFGSHSVTSISGLKDFFIAKYDQSGNCIWVKRAGGNGNDVGISIAFSNNSLYVTGTYFSDAIFGSNTINSYGDADFFLVKYDLNGNNLWAKGFGSFGSDVSFKLESNSSGDIYLTGSFQNTVNFGGVSLSSSGSSDIFVSKYDASGLLLWANKAGGNGWETSYDLHLNENDDIFITGVFSNLAQFGSYQLLSFGSEDLFVAKYNSAGNVLWVKKGGGRGYDRGYGISSVNDNVFICGMCGQHYDSKFDCLSIYNPYSGFLQLFAKITSSPFFLNLGNDTTLCQGQTITLDATIPNATYLWQDKSTNPTLNITQQGIYWVEVRVNNCSITDTININYNPLPTIGLGNDTTLCQGEMVTLDATIPNATYLWQDNSTNSTLNITQQGIYWVKITNACGSTADTIIIHFRSKPTIYLGNDTILCQGETVTLNAITPNATYLWQDNSTNPTFKVTQQGTYWTEVTVNNCSAADTIKINYNLLPTIALGNDTTLCQGETVTLNATTPNATYLWQDNSTNASFKVTQQGTYWTEVRVNNCSTADTILVNYNPFPTIALGKDTILCQGETLTLDATTSNATYLWQDNSTNSNLKVTQQGIYWVKITDGCGSASDTMNIHYSLLPTIALGNDTTLCQGETVTLDAITPNATYLWQDNSTNPTFKVTHQGAYWVEVTVNNCSALSTVLIVEEDCKITLEIPDVFTPNNDGINDLFVPIDSKGIVSMNTIIYNRWGEKVFESNKLLIEWSGQDVSDGTYFWIVNYTDINGVSNSIKGFVTILR